MSQVKPEGRLSDLPDLYATRVHGGCMSPAIVDGSVIAVSKVATVRPGDFVTLWFRPECVPPGTSPVQVKKLVGREGPNLFIERFVPHGLFSVHPSELLAVHKVIGLLPESKPGGSHDPKTIIPIAACRAA